MAITDLTRDLTPTPTTITVYKTIFIRMYTMLVILLLHLSHSRLLPSYVWLEFQVLGKGDLVPAYKRGRRECYWK